jgi:hypothetical protein
VCGDKSGTFFIYKTDKALASLSRFVSPEYKQERVFVMTNYSIKRTDSRARMWEHLERATGEGNTSTALDEAARYYLRMAGGTDAYPTGRLEELIATAEEEGSLTAAEIVDILDADELPLTYTSEWGVGNA